jgi:predicted phosphodiesterase
MWQPNDENKFKKAYFAGMQDYQIASIFGCSPDQVRKYLLYLRQNDGLPHRRDFEPTEITVDDFAKNDFIEIQIIKKIKSSKKKFSIISLANEYNVVPRIITDIINKLKLDDYLVDIRGDDIMCNLPNIGESSEHYFDYVNGNKFKFGVISDTHYGSKYASHTITNDIYDIFESRGVETVYLPGNYIDGEASFNKSDLLVHGFENQVNYFVKYFPQRKGITTYFIDGDDHEGWYTQKMSINVGKRVQETARAAGRNDLVYLGYMEHDVEVPAKNPGAKTTIRIAHPGGGSSYAISYAMQKLIESLSGGDKPRILIAGHTHKSGYFFIRNVHTIQAGCTERQTPFMRKKRLAAHLGAWIVEITQGDDGSVLGICPEFIPFYDTDTSDDKWEYKAEMDQWLPIMSIKE